MDDYYDEVYVPDEETLENTIIDPYWTGGYSVDPYDSLP